MSQGKDIVLIKTNSQRKIYQDLSEDFTGIEPPLWLALTAAFLRQKGFSVTAIDAEADDLNTKETVQKVLSHRPLLAAIVVSGTNPSASTMNMIGANEVLNHLKETAPQIPTAISGLHPSALPERTIREEQVDFAIEGEGFSTYAELIGNLKSGKKVGDDFRVSGLWYRKDGKIISNPRAPNIADLGQLPMPAWDLLPIKRYRAHNWHCFQSIDDREPYAVIFTSLGCPFSCSFCCINVTFGGIGIRYRPPQKVAEEIDYLVKNYGIKNIKMLDEMFVLKSSHVSELCDRIIALGHNLNFWVYGRIDTVNENLLKKMKEAGVNWIAYGIESGSKKVRDGVSKGRFDQDAIRKVVKMTHDIGMHIVANFIFGLPDDDEATIQETLHLAKELNCEYSNFYCAMAYPGSQLYKDAIAQGLPLPKTWAGYAQFSEETFPLPTKYLSGAQILRFRDKAFDDYYSDPRYLDMMTEKFGPKTVAHIKKMCSVKLRRKYANNNEEVHFHGTVKSA